MAAIAALVCAASGVGAQALAPNTLPQGGVVSQGAANFRGVGTAGAPVLNIDQGSQRAVINWNSFNLGSAGTVNFNQPNAQSATLNRVLDMNPSQILGQIRAPGQVTLVNPAGVYFGPGAVLDVGALTASTLQQTDADFMAGVQRFQRAGSTGKVTNEGRLNASSYIALLAPEVRNQGTVTASAVAMASGESIQLNFDAFSRLASLSVKPSQIAALVENRTAVLAPGGLVILSAQALSGLRASVINGGQIDATSLVSRGGRILLEADSIALKAGSQLLANGATGGGTVLVGGDWQGSGDMAQATTVVMERGAVIEASAMQSGDGGKVVLWSDVGNEASRTSVHGRITARGGPAGGNGGKVETSGHVLGVGGAVVIASAAKGVAGEWLLDPTDITITDAATSPGVLDVGNPTYTGSDTSNVSAADISATLSAGTSVTVRAGAATGGAGDITVDTRTGINYTGAGPVSLTLKAHNNIALTGSAISSTNGRLDVTLNSDSDANFAGAIGVDAGSSIVTRGGDIRLSGNIIGGSPRYAYGSDPAHKEGIVIAGVVDAGGGAIDMWGQGFQAGTNDNVGILLTNSRISTSGYGLILLYGIGSNRTGTNNDGMRLSGASIVNTGNGQISLRGSADDTSGNTGIVANTSDVLSSSGPIQLFGSRGGGGAQGLVWMGGNIGAKPGSAVTTSSSNVQVYSDWLAMPSAPSGPTTFATTGTVQINVNQNWAGTGFYDNSGFVVADTVTGLAIGNPASNAVAVVLANPVLINGPVAIYGESLRVNGIVSTAAGADVLLSADPFTPFKGIDILAPITLAAGGTLQLASTKGVVGQNTSGNVTADKLQLAGGAGFLLATAPNNAIGTVAGTGIGSIKLLNNAALTVGTVNGVNGIGVSSVVEIATRSGDLTIAQNVGTTDPSPFALLLNAGRDAAAGTAAGGNLIFSGGNAIPGAGGTARLMSGSISGSTAMTTQTSEGSRYNSDETTTNYTLALGAGRYGIYREAPVVSSFTVNDATKVYNGAAFSGGNGYVYGTPTMVNGDSPTLATGTVSFGGAAQNKINAGNYALTATVSNPVGYVYAYTPGILSITPKPVTLTGTRSYNGLASVASGMLAIGGMVGTETLTLTGAGAMADAHVGSNKPVAPATLSLGDGTNGGLAGNYSIGSATATIDKANLTLTTNNVSKTYDGTLSALGTAVASGAPLFGTDTLSGGTFAFTDKNAGSGNKTVTVSGVTVNDGNGGGNYNVSYADNTSSTISRKDVTATGARAYDGSTSIAGSVLTSVSGTVGGETLSVGTGGNGSVAGKDVGNGKVVSVAGLSLADGSGLASNYNLVGATADITRKDVAATGTRVYDSTVDVAGGIFSTSTGVGTETLTFTGIGTVGDKHVGAGKAVTPGTLTLVDGTNGGAASNYNLTSVTADITKANLSVTTSDVTKVYDGSLTALGTAQGSGLFGTDTVGGGSFAFLDKNAGTGKTVTTTGVTVNDGNGGNNYSVSYVNNTTSTLNKKDINASGARAYDGTAIVAGAIFNTSTGVGTETLTLTGSGTVGDKHVGTGKAVTPGTLALVDGTNGGAASNYNLISASANITQADLSVSVNDVTKVYDGNTSAAATAVGTGLLGTDAVTGGTWVFNDRNAGAGNKTVSNAVAATVNDGNSGNNYSVSYVDNTNSTINRKDITASGTRAYDGSNLVDGGVLTGMTGLVGSETLNFTSGVSGTMADQHVGVAKAVAIGGLTLADGTNGGVASNYSLTGATADITKANLSVTTSDVTKVYDGNLTALGTAQATGLVGGDTVGGGSFAFLDKNAGTGKTVTTTGVTVNDGNSGNNYNVSYVNNTSSTINRKDITASGSRVYDGGNLVDGSVLAGLTGLVGSETLNFTSGVSGTMADKHVGVAKTVAIGALALADGTNGGVASNYNLTGATADITKANLSVSVNDVTKVYDGNTSAAATAVGTGLLGTDSVTGGTWMFIDKDAGVGNKSLSNTVAATVNDGNGGNNYSVSYTSNTTSSITRKDITALGARVYDGTAIVAGGIFNPSTGVGTETLTFTGSGTVGDKHVGAGKLVTPGALALADGTNGGVATNYSLTGATADITKANLSVSVNDVIKVYDGNTTAVATLQNSGLAGTDTVTGGTFAFTNKNVGSGNKTVTVSGVTVNDGNSGGNYSVSYANNTASSITPASVLFTTSDVSKTYDGTTKALGTAVVSGAPLFGTDTMTGGTFAFTNKNVGSGNKTVTVSGVTVNDGNSGNNYNVSYTNNTTSTINPLAITFSTNDVTKIYDGATSAAGTAFRSAGTLASGDSFGGGTFAFLDKNAGTGKTVTTSGVALADGNGGANYTVSYADNTNSSISPAALTVTAPTVTKTYDGNTSAIGLGAVGVLAGGVAGEHVGVTPTLLYTNPNAGAGNKTVRAAGLTILDAGNNDVSANYSVSYIDNMASTINRAPLTVTANNDARFVTLADTPGFNGASYSGLVGGESSGVLGGTLAISRSNAATDQGAGSYTGVLVPSGLASGNYDISFANGSYTIVPANQLLIRVDNTTSVYGTAPGFTVASAQYLDGANVMHDLAGTASGNSFDYADGAGGSVHFTLTPQGAGTSGAGKTVVGNYTLGDANPAVVGSNFLGAPVFVGNLNVTQKGVTASAPGASKVYDASTAFTGGVLRLTGQESGDVLLVNGSGGFAQKNVGDNLAYKLNNVAIAGADAGNYYLTGGTTVSGIDGRITPAPIAVGSGDVVKTYDGTTSAAGNLRVVGGRLFGNDSLGGGSFAFSDRNAGQGNKTVVTSGVAVADGNGGNNYAVTMVDNTTSTINRAGITLSTSDVVKTYDGTTQALGSAVVVGGALFGSDSLGGGSFAFKDPNVGTGKTVTAAAIGVQDGNGGGNYLVSYADNTNSAINAVVSPPAPPPEPPPLQPAGPSPWTNVPGYVQPAATLQGTADDVQGSSDNADKESVFPPPGSVAPGTVAAFACEGLAHAAPDCGTRQAAGAYVVVTPLRRVSAVLAGQVLVQVSSQVLQVGRFDAALPEAVMQAFGSRTAGAVASLRNGEPLPAWLSFDAETLSLAARAMPTGALPLTVLARRGAYEVEVEISGLK